MSHWETVWHFHTAQFSVALQLTPCEDDPADSFEFDNHIAAIRNGDVEWFDARVVVLAGGREIGADYLGNCAYKNAAEFYQGHWRASADSRNTLAAKARKTSYCHYFPDMVRAAIADARKTLCALPKLRCA